MHDNGTVSPKMILDARMDLRLVQLVVHSDSVTDHHRSIALDIMTNRYLVMDHGEVVADSFSLHTTADLYNQVLPRR